MVEVPEQPIELETADGEHLVGTLFGRLGGDGGEVPDVGVGPVVLLPALGTPARVYAEAAAELAGCGIPAVTIDLRGTGRSKPPPARGRDWGFDAHLRGDLPALQAWLEHCGATSPVWAGHSYGGHLAAAHLAQRPQSGRALLLLATSDIGFRHWGTGAAPILAVTQFFALVSVLCGYFPGRRLGFGRPAARQVILDWARWARSGRFRGSDGADFQPSLAALRKPVLSISFADDRRMARRAAVDAFAARLEGCEVERWHLEPSEIGRERVGHFGFLSAARPLWERVADWLRAHAAPAERG